MEVDAAQRSQRRAGRRSKKSERISWKRKMTKGITLVIPQRTVVYVGVALVVSVLVVLNVYAFFISGNKEGSSSGKSVENTAENFAVAKAAENPSDKCATPPGYTDEQWREHMGHHPDQYSECL